MLRVRFSVSIVIIVFRVDFIGFLWWIVYGKFLFVVLYDYGCGLVV